MSKMSKAQKIAAFNENNHPFYLVDHKDEVSLCCVFHPMPGSEFSLGQEAFNRYAESIGEPVKDRYGLYTHGSGYEWEYVFRKVFENDPNIDKVSYDCEAGGFFAYGEDVDMMADFGHRFLEIMQDEDALMGFIHEAISEGEQREAEMAELRSTVRGFLMEHPNASVNMMTPYGFVQLAPEDGKALLEGNPITIPNAVMGYTAAIEADSILDLHITACAPNSADPSSYSMITESPPEEEYQGFWMSI